MAVISAAPGAVRRALDEAHDLNTWLYRYRMTLFMTQKEMAEEYGVARTTYASWEQGVLPRAEHMVALCAYHPEHSDRLALMWRVSRAVQDWQTKETVQKEEIGVEKRREE